ncbi:MsnO8 family LLM class oxidoreductase [Geomicrobium sp. JCM 19039]|uniref:MsnO8 family LLM class oxidoreductase n=1 Tax=Geomicrobium sp. JCM 19039 TaxID=1460636 RepID=UPI00045F3F01|nr:MsnO8 family LLM class oxidoreductase [Geomicrobium sp. JCM 19039]GAK14607.1 luciferase family protein [Geomicrobium sp. JCM 19039]
MKLSILDSSPLASGKTSADAFSDSKDLAVAGEKLGYTRYWMTEHHDLNGLAASAPEVLLAYIGAATSTIRLGTGAILLPHYKPFKVAELHHTLATLFPGRIDLGIGRAPGGSAEVTNALNDNFLQQVYRMPELIDELLSFIDLTDESVTASPIPPVKPEAWILGTSAKSAQMAATKGTSYAFGQWMSDTDGLPVIEDYYRTYAPRNPKDSSQALMTVGAICAQTTEEAERLAKTLFVWQEQSNVGNGSDGIPAQVGRQLTADEKAKFDTFKKKTIVGNPEEVARHIQRLCVNEVMIHTPLHHIADRIRSYELIATELGIRKQSSV